MTVLVCFLGKIRTTLINNNNNYYTTLICLIENNNNLERVNTFARTRWLLSYSTPLSLYSWRPPPKHMLVANAAG